MKKILLTTLAVAAITTSASATTTTNVVNNANGTQTTTTTTVTTTPVHKSVAHHHYHHVVRPVASAPAAVNANYRQIHVGDPTVVYHEIGTSGAQRNNTIVPFYNEPIQSVKPYEIRYDYSI